MLVQKTSEIDIESTLDGEHIDLSIDESALVHLMGVLTNLYTDAELAVIREYSTNAWDAHVEAGVTRPIEVTLPTNLSPFLKIQDFGIGMDLDDIRNTYSRYGASTKRETNEQTGMLGLGCKSALTYTSQFVLVAVKNGQRVQVSISRDDTGAGAMDVSEAEPTTDGNGVTIIVPSRNHYSITEKANEFFSYWDPKRVLVNGEHPTPIKGLQITPTIKVIEDHPRHEVVMGGVAYPIDLPGLNLYYSHKVVAEVPIGTVIPAPSREGLRDVKQNKLAAAKISNEFNENVGAAIESSLAAAATPLEALRFAVNWRKAFPNAKIEYVYKGEEIPTHITPDSVAIPATTKDAITRYYNDRLVVVNKDSYKVSAFSKDRSVPVGFALKSLWITGYHNDDNDLLSFTATHKKKLLMYCNENDIDVNGFILCHTLPKSKWIDSTNKIDWETIKALRLPHHQARRAPSNRPKGSYDIYVAGVYKDGVPATQINPKGNLYYVGYKEDALAAQICEVDKKATVVPLAANRVAKFLRDFPQAKESHHAFLKAYKKLRKTVTDEDFQIKALKDDWRIRREYERIDPTKVDDPEIKRVCSLLHRDIDVDAIIQLHNLAHRARMWDDLKFDAISVTLISDKYPLFQYNMADHDHMYIYLNAAYAARQEAN